MPQNVSYSANSVIYFRGDASKKIFILQSGRVILKREDIESGTELQEAIQTGEFFGVKSALSNYPRDEDAIVVTDSNVVVFTVPEFEALVSQNARVGMKMLKVFSNQLRKIQGKMRALLAIDEQKLPEDGLYECGEFYLKKKRYREAIHILRAYIKTYPTGRFLANASKYLKQAEEYAQKYPAGSGPSIISESRGGSQQRGPQAAPSKKAAPPQSAEEKIFYDAMSLQSQGKYPEAQAAYANLLKTCEDEELKRKTNFEIGRCIFGTKNYDAAIKHFGFMVKQYGDFPEIGDVLFHVGQGYERLGDKAKAMSFYDRILSLENVEEDMKRKVKQAQKAAGAK